MNIRAVTAVADSCTFPLFKFTLTRANEVDVNFDMFADQLFPEELAGLDSIVRLLRVILSRSLISAATDEFH